MMKKLPVVLVIAASVMLASCNGKNNSTDSNVSKDKVASTKSVITPIATSTNSEDSVSLNGIKKDDVEKMTRAFEEKALYQATPTPGYQVWLDKKVIIGMYEFLKREITNTPVSNHKPDGFRIYFLDNGTFGNPNLAFVATKDCGEDKAVRRKHIDYYHKNNGTLFTMGTLLQGTIRTDNDAGALLHKNCTGDECKSLCDTNGVIDEERIPRSVAQAMAQYTGKIVYNTKSLWFSFGLLETFFKLMSADQQINGARLYLANYGRKVNNLPRSSKKLMRYTFILTPTKLTGANVNKDVFNCGVEKFWFQQTEGDGGFNNGELCPANCNVDDEGGATEDLALKAKKTQAVKNKQ